LYRSVLLKRLHIAFQKALRPTKWVKISAILWPLTGCAAALPVLPALSGLMQSNTGPEVLTTTHVNLSRQNFKMVKSNAIGESMGFSLLGLITLKSPGYAEAITRLYQQANISEGKAQALVNMVHEHSSNFFILFALPKITVRADVIEYTGNAVSAKSPESENKH
jgi:hypothetical protein